MFRVCKRHTLLSVFEGGRVVDEAFRANQNGTACEFPTQSPGTGDHMSIRVTRIMGESFDLETGHQLPKSIVLTNGVKEIPVFVDDDVALAVIEMMTGESAPKKSSPALETKPERPLATPVRPVESSYIDPDTGAESL